MIFPVDGWKRKGKCLGRWSGSCWEKKGEKVGENGVIWEGCALLG